MTNEKVWNKQMETHLRHMKAHIHLYIKGFMTKQQLEQDLRKLICDSALWNAVEGAEMDKVKTIINNLSIDIPERFKE